MYTITPPDLDAPVRSLSLWRSFEPNNMVFLHRGQTRLELVNALATVINLQIPTSTRIWMLISETEVILTFFVCAVMLYKKQALGKLWLITRRHSSHGTFFVSNAVFCIVTGVTLYLVAWDSTAMVILVFSYLRTSVMQWWWVIPLPWLPLVLGAYISVHGFAVGCSPRSPLAAQNEAARGKWFYLPIVRNAPAANAILILPCAAFISSTVSLVGLSGHSYYHAKSFARHMLAPDVWTHIHERSAANPGSLLDADALASDELVWLARTVAAKYLQVHRYVCLNLVIFAFAAFVLYIPYLIYGIPNVMHLVDHTYSCYSQPLPASYKHFHQKLWFLLTKGRPSSKQTVMSVNLGTWKMTILAIIYMVILLACVPAFGALPIFIVVDTFPHRVLAGDLGVTVHRAILAVSTITVLSCSFVALFCTVATLDPLFRAAIGLNILRPHIPINIDVETRRSQFEENYGHELVSPVEMFREKSRLTSTQALDRASTSRTIKFQSSRSTFGDSSSKSPLTNEYPDYPVDQDQISSSDHVNQAVSSQDARSGTGVGVTVITKQA